MVLFVYPLTMTEMLVNQHMSSQLLVAVCNRGGDSICASIQYQPFRTASLVHISKIKEHLSKIRDIILSDNGEDGVALVDKLSHEQAKIEKWIIAINNGMTTFNSLIQLFLFINNLINLIIIASLNSIGPIIFMVSLEIYMWIILANGLYALAKPNMVWNNKRYSY